MSAEAFLDTNVLIYQLDTRDLRKHRIAEALVGAAVATGNACISHQVIQECLNVVLNKAEVRLDAAGARAYFDNVLTPLSRVASSLALYRKGLALKARWGFGFYDALIVAGALEAGCTRLLSEDLQHGQVIETLTIENPFRRK